MTRRNPLDRDEQITLRRARLQQTPGAELALPTGGTYGGGPAGAVVAGVWTRFGVTNIDVTGAFITAPGLEG